MYVQVGLLRSAGERVTLTVGKLADKDGETISTFFLTLPNGKMTEVFLFLSEMTEGEGEGGGDHWIPFKSVPLKLATVSSYAVNTAITR